MGPYESIRFIVYSLRSASTREFDLELTSGRTWSTGTLATSTRTLTQVAGIANLALTSNKGKSSMARKLKWHTLVDE